MNAETPGAAALPRIRRKGAGGRPVEELQAERSERRKERMLLLAPVGVENEISFYFRLIKNCEDDDRLTTLAKIVGGELAPHQLKRLYERVAGLPDAEKVKRFRAQAPGWMLFQKQEPPVFENSRLSTHARLFEAAGVPKAEKTLLVLFSGRRGEAFMPISRMLAKLPRATFDVLRLRADTEGEYPRGVPGLGGSFRAVCDHLRGMAAEYAGGAALGASLGGFAALRAAVLAEFAVGVSLSGRFTKFKPDETAMDVAAFDPLCGCVRSRRTTLLAYFSADNETDALNGENLTTMHPSARLHPVANSQDHNVVAQLVATGEFDVLFANIKALATARPN